jgi:hypothetical protein
MDTPASCSINPFNGHSHCTGPGECLLRPCITYALTLSFLIFHNHAALRFSYALCLEFRYINLNPRGMSQFAGFDQPQESAYSNNSLYGNGGSLPLAPSLPSHSLPPALLPSSPLPSSRSVRFFVFHVGICIYIHCGKNSAL